MLSLAARRCPRGVSAAVKLASSRSLQASSSPLRLQWLGTRGWASSSLIAPHLFEKVLSHQASPAIVSTDDLDKGSTYAGLAREAFRLRDDILTTLKPGVDQRQPRIAYLGERGPSYLAIQWAIWLAGGMAVPLHPAHPQDELDYILSDSGASLLIASESFAVDADSGLREYIAELLQRAGVPVLVHQHRSDCNTSKLEPEHTKALREWVDARDHENEGAYMVYTSGTTGRPKGVVTTHAALTAQIHDVVSAWEMSERDHLVHFLPLHHVHGILNNLLCVLYAGGSVEFLSSASTDVIWKKLGRGSSTSSSSSSSSSLSSSPSSSRPVTMFMAVPTVYMKLLEAMDEMEKRASESEDPALVADIKTALDGARRLRVAISGSMACPVSILNRWEERTGLRLLERYGMTELGMVLTNPLHGERHMGYVGDAFPSVSVRVVDPETEQEVVLESEQEGELRVKGPTVFREYWGRPEATAKEFDALGWFKTGDIVQYSVARRSFRIRGRASADILKSAGYKISALDVERALLGHPEVAECAVFGLPDETWGQVVSAVVRVSGDAGSFRADSFSPPLNDFMRDQMADYRVPRKYFFVNEIPKNAMGKVNKKQLAKFFAEK